MLTILPFLKKIFEIKALQNFWIAIPLNSEKKIYIFKELITIQWKFCISKDTHREATDRQNCVTRFIFLPTPIIILLYSYNSSSKYNRKFDFSVAISVTQQVFANDYKSTIQAIWNIPLFINAKNRKGNVVAQLIIIHDEFMSRTEALDWILE